MSVLIPLFLRKTIALQDTISAILPKPSEMASKCYHFQSFIVADVTINQLAWKASTPTVGICNKLEHGVIRFLDNANLCKSMRLLSKTVALFRKVRRACSMNTPLGLFLWKTHTRARALTQFHRTFNQFLPKNKKLTTCQFHLCRQPR